MAVLTPKSGIEMGTLVQNWSTLSYNVEKWSNVL